MTTATREAEIFADPNVPTIRITRDFNATADKVFRAWIDPELFARWIGPHNLTTRIERHDGQTGGSYRYVNIDPDGNEYVFFGSFHEVRTNERIVQTFGFEEFPDGACLETLTFENLGDGRTRVVTLSVLDSFEARDGMLSSGMDVGVNEGYEKLDQLLEGQE